MNHRRAALYCSAPMINTALTSVLGEAGWSIASGDEPGDLAAVLVVVRSSRGITEIRELRARHGDVPVVALTDYAEADLTAEAVEAGATSVVPWDSHAEVLVAAMELARHSMATLTIDTLRFIAGNGTGRVGITDAERSWLQHLERDITIAQLAPLAGYSERSLYRQLNQLYHRLGVTDRSSAIAEARRRDLL